MIRRLLLLVVLLVFCVSSVVSAGTMDDLLLKSVLENNLKMVKSALANGAEINYKQDKYSRPPLCVAISEENVNLVKFLLENGADVNLDYFDIGTIGKANPLILAVHRSNAEIIQILIDAGANINCVGRNNDDTPLIIALSSIDVDLNVVGTLLANNADINKSDKYGTTPLMINTRYDKLSTDDKIKRLAIGTVLLDMGADPNIINKDMRKALDFAIENDFDEMIELLLPVTKK